MFVKPSRSCLVIRNTELIPIRLFSVISGRDDILSGHEIGKDKTLVRSRRPFVIGFDLGVIDIDHVQIVSEVSKGPLIAIRVLSAIPIRAARIWGNHREISLNWSHL